ncbi:MAG: hypothetical protein WA821_06850 [Anaerolineales bacterium]
MSKPFPRPSWWLLAIAAFAALERLALWLVYPPVTFDDTNSYRRLAGQFLHATPMDGTRSPGYPIFLAGLGQDRVVYAVQLALGLAITLLFFYLGWLVSGKSAVGAAAALIHTLNMGQLLFEADLLAETLTTFLVMVTICGGVYLLKKETFKKFSLKELGLALLTGIAGGLAALVRPQFVFLPFLIAFVLMLQAAQKSTQAQNLLSTKDTKFTKKELLRFFFVNFVNACPRMGVVDKTLWAVVFAIVIPAILLNALWINYIHTQFGAWSMSSDDGYHIIQHTGKFFEYVPDQYAAIRDTFLKYRAIQIANTGAASNTIWAAIPALQKVSGLGFYKLSRKLQEISWQLIREHPLLYLGSVCEAWFWFWSAPFYWNPQVFGAVGDWVAQAQRFLLWAANAVFVAGTFALVFGRVRKTLSMPVVLWLVLAIVWVNSILQAIVEASENPRYSISTQTLVVLVVAWWVWRIIRRGTAAEFKEKVLQVLRRAPTRNDL